MNHYIALHKNTIRIQKRYYFTSELLAIDLSQRKTCSESETAVATQTIKSDLKKNGKTKSR